MRRQDFHFDLPQALIAQRPPEKRGDSRLLVLERDSGTIHDQAITGLAQWLRPGDLMVFNDTRVVAARLLGRKTTGGRVELLLERLVDGHSALFQIRASKAPKGGTQLLIDDHTLEVTGREGDFFSVRSEIPLLTLLERCGHVPLPPYIDRPDDDDDLARYQTVYAAEPGAVAAPTAGLHFTVEHLEALRKQGIETGFLTLHVGAGTFSPIRVDDIAGHQMHREWGRIDATLARQIATTRQRGGRVVAVGTTSVRTLESAWDGSQVAPWEGETDLFIYPGVTLNACDAILTNFHLPQSTLIMLVCAFAGRDSVLNAYRHAVDAGYRFFSYGDAMLIV